MKDFFDRLLGKRPQPPAPNPAPQEDDDEFAFLEAPEPGAEPEGPIDWQAEMRRELAFGHRASHPFGRAPEAAQAPLSYSSSAGYDPSQVPTSFEAYRTLLHQQFDAPKRALAKALAEEPYVRAAFDAWRPGQVKANLNILYAVFDKASAQMGRIFRFHPAPLGYDPQMGQAIGSYHPARRRIMLAERLLHEPVEEFFATLIHEQVHKLQHEMKLRLDHPSAHPLSLQERALVYYWLWEEPRVAHYYARAWNDIQEGRGDAAYRRIGKEYHAFDTEEHVVAVLKQRFRR